MRCAHHSSLVTHHSSLITRHSSLVTHHSSLITHSLIHSSCLVLAARIARLADIERAGHARVAGAARRVRAEVGVRPFLTDREVLSDGPASGLIEPAWNDNSAARSDQREAVRRVAL